LTIDLAKKLSFALKVPLSEIIGENSYNGISTDSANSILIYKQMIQNFIRYGAGDDGKITKTKLAKLVYLADFTWYYLQGDSMSRATYRKLRYGPVSNIYFSALDEMEEDGVIVRDNKGTAVLFSLVENVCSTDKLNNDKIKLIKKIATVWKNKPTEEIVNFTHSQLPWQICYDNEIIPYGLITQEEQDKVYGDVKI
jgi:uncharacterized phage-associated protein